MSRGFAIPKGVRPRAARRASPYHIGDEYVTLAEIAARLGVVERTAAKRIAAARESEGPVTWASLERPR